MTPKTHAPLEVVNAFINAINHHKPAEIARLMSQDHTLVDSRGESHSGRDHLLEGWKGYLQMFPDFEICVEALLEKNETVGVFGRTCGTYNGKRGLVAENRVEMTAAWKAIVKLGKVQRWQIYTDWTQASKVIEADEMAGWQS
jgi:ketosteroid isomerase-like protein